LRTASYAAWLVNCSFEDMKKSLSSTKAVVTAMEDPGVPGDKAERPKQQVQGAKMHSHFDPSRIGFGIMGAAKDVNRKSMDTDEVVASTNNCIQSNPRRAIE
jgi:hypothetical protein